ncbi:MAG: GNAT family N-acetyltransferase [Akkermansiaceae bacterium]|nr:GNAT family N-acetyltransferase [Armatimonadota bacterium]
MSDISVRAESPRTEDATRLLREAFNELARRYAEYSQTDAALFPVEQAEQAGAVFLIARLAGVQAVGCVVLRPLPCDGQSTAEMKRMFVTVEARGRGVGSALMALVEREARALGYSRLRLETGDLQPEAIALYEKHAFIRIPCWGTYATDPASVCYEKVINRSI